MWTKKQERTKELESKNRTKRTTEKKVNALTLKQAFIAAFYFMDLYYIETKDDALADLLGNMNPYLWADGGSADPAAEEDWNNVAKAIKCGTQINPEQAFLLMYEYLNFHKTGLGYDVEWLMNDLAKKPHDTPEWLECITKAINPDESTISRYRLQKP